MSESKILREIRLALGARDDVVVWRNNSGVLRDERGQHVRYGLCPGSADLIGIYKPTGQFLAIEVKRPGQKLRDEQELFARLVVLSGGLHATVTSAQEACDFIDYLKDGD